MRIVGGIWRGHALDAPQGRDHTRPTTDRTRESIASMVLSARGLDLTGASVLDAFAGSGALGFELLSRGAAHATFVDTSRAAQTCLRRNRERLGLDATQAEILSGDVMKLAASDRLLSGAPFSIIMLDPPYALDIAPLNVLLDTLALRGRLSEDALVVYEHGVDSPGLDATGLGMCVVRSKRHGITVCDLLKRGCDEHDQPHAK